MERIKWKSSSEQTDQIELEELPNGLMAMFSHPYEIEIKTLRSGKTVLKIVEPDKTDK